MTFGIIGDTLVSLLKIVPQRRSDAISGVNEWTNRMANDILIIETIGVCGDKFSMRPKQKSTILQHVSDRWLPPLRAYQ